MIPLFPLEIVVFPSAPLPLHIFEPRYIEMIQECLANGKEFGIVLSKGKKIYLVGTTVKIENVLERFPDGRLNILCMGKDRFTVRSFCEDRSFLQAQVDFIDDADLASARLLPLSEETRCILDEYSKITGRRAESGLFDTFDPQALSFLLADIVPYELTHRQKLLESMSCVTRLDDVNSSLKRFNKRLSINIKLREFFKNSHDYTDIVN